MADQQPVQHIVLFKFPRELTPDEERWMKQQIRRWSSEIGGFTRLRLGRDITGKRNRGNQYLLFTEFPSDDALQAYFTHPAHQEFGKWVAEMECEVLAFDYALDPETSIVG